MNGEIQGDHYGIQVNMKLEGSTVAFSRNQAPQQMIYEQLVVPIMVLKAVRHHTTTSGNR